MQLGNTILYVPDVPATLKFYEVASKLTTRVVHKGSDYGELQSGSWARTRRQPRSCPTLRVRSERPWTEFALHPLRF